MEERIEVERSEVPLVNSENIKVESAWTLLPVHQPAGKVQWLPRSMRVTDSPDDVITGLTIEYSSHTYVDAIQRAIPYLAVAKTSDGVVITKTVVVEARGLKADETVETMTAVPTHGNLDPVHGEASLLYVEDYNGGRKESTFKYTDGREVVASHQGVSPAKRASLGTIALVLSIAVAVAGAGWMIVKKVSSNA